MMDCKICNKNLVGNYQKFYDSFGNSLCDSCFMSSMKKINPKPNNIGIDATLNERGNRDGEFVNHAKITQDIKRSMQAAPKWDGLSDDKKECLEMIAHKIGWILNGDPNYHDSWHDIIVYARLVEKELTLCQAK